MRGIIYREEEPQIHDVLQHRRRPLRRSEQPKEWVYLTIAHVQDVFAIVAQCKADALLAADLAAQVHVAHGGEMLCELGEALMRLAIRAARDEFPEVNAAWNTLSAYDRVALLTHAEVYVRDLADLALDDSEHPGTPIGSLVRSRRDRDALCNLPCSEGVERLSSVMLAMANDVCKVRGEPVPWTRPKELHRAYDHWYRQTRRRCSRATG